MERPFQLVDVFAEQPFLGNPLAVVHQADDLSAEAMQAITRWINFSETAFLLRPTANEADYRVRIFTPARELPFAGHPTLGSCQAWLNQGGRPRNAAKIVQECAAGIIPLTRQDNTLAFAAPPLLRTGPVEEAKLAELAGVMRVDQSRFVASQWVDNGPGWVVVMLESAEAVLAVEPVRQHPTQLDLGIVGPYPAGSGAAFELRALFTNQNGDVGEDPVTGSLNASVAQWLLSSGRATAPYTASQGTRLGRRGRVSISQDADGTVWVGGRATTLFQGTTTF